MTTLNDIKEKIKEIRHCDFKIEEITYYNKSYKVCGLIRSVLIQAMKFVI